MAIDMVGDMQVIDTAHVDRVVCLLGTADGAGQPNISPKGSMMVFDATRLAYWERAGRTALANLGANARVVVYYRNSAKSDRFPNGATWRFYGTAEVLVDGSLRDEVWERVIPGEQEKDLERKGAAVVITVERINDLGGNILQEL
jgi:predicted pyridoxine 5'-phosphate oxidase superfamily flavin-nucleotide-binding protein